MTKHVYIIINLPTFREYLFSFETCEIYIWKLQVKNEYDIFSLITNICSQLYFRICCKMINYQNSSFFCFQMMCAQIVSFILFVLMVLVIAGVIRSAVEETLCSTSIIFICFIAGIFVIATILHPKVRIRLKYSIKLSIRRSRVFIKINIIIS